MRRAHLGCCVERGEVPTQRRLRVPSFSIGRCLPMFPIIYMDHLEVPRSCISEQMGCFALHRDANAPPLWQGGRGTHRRAALQHHWRCHLRLLWRGVRCCCFATPPLLQGLLLVRAPRASPSTPAAATALLVATPSVLPVKAAVAGRLILLLCNNAAAAKAAACSLDATGHLPQLRRSPPKLHWNTSAAI